MAVSMFDTAGPCWDLIDRTRGRIGNHVAELRLVPGRGICVAKTGGSHHWSVWGQPTELHAAITRYLGRLDVPISVTSEMTYSVFDSTGNLVDAFDDRAAAIAALKAIVKTEPDAADDMFLVAQDEDGKFVGETVYGSSLHVTA
ncbi:MAG: hypothetical protein JO181_20530 [Solirubrobacterales bacterium]|nr:hypothetical protein [Solirubrobacterales bacterium]